MNEPRNTSASNRTHGGGSSAAADSIWGGPTPSAKDSSFLHSPSYAGDSSYEMADSGVMPPTAVFERPLRIINVIDVPTAQQSPDLDPVRAEIAKQLQRSGVPLPGGSSWSTGSPSSSTGSASPATGFATSSAMEPSVRSRSH